MAERLHNIRLIKICHTEVLEELRLSKNLSNYYEYVQNLNNLGQKSGKSKWL